MTTPGSEPPASSQTDDSGQASNPGEAPTPGEAVDPGQAVDPGEAVDPGQASAFNPADLARAQAAIARLSELWGDEPPPEPALLGWDREP
ncbi:MAG: hypothetical protein IT307_13655 [Chloroflexi bacterium]|nr:hypothetical protein [Chloroflexota bacterium]